MQKSFKILTLLLLLAAFLMPTSVLAQGKIPNCCKVGREVTFDGVIYAKDSTVGWEDTCNLTNSPPNRKTKQWGLICLLGTVYVIVDWVFVFLIAFVGVMIILGAFTLVTAAGEPDKVKKGKNYILYGAIGLIFGLLAKAIPPLIETLVGL